MHAQHDTTAEFADIFLCDYCQGSVPVPTEDLGYLWMPRRKVGYLLLRGLGVAHVERIPNIGAQ